MSEEILLLEVSGSDSDLLEQVNNLKQQVEYLECENIKLLGELNEVKARNEELCKLNKAQSRSENFKTNEMKVKNKEVKFRFNEARSKFEGKLPQAGVALGCSCGEEVADLQNEVETLKENLAAKQKLILEVEGRVENAVLVEIELKEKLHEAKLVSKDKDEIIEKLEDQNKQFEELIQSLREQLESSEVGKRKLETLISAQAEAKDRLKIAHHQNNLKIQRWVKMEQENPELKREVLGLKEQLTKTKRTVNSLEEKLKSAQGSRRDLGVFLQSQDKENSRVKNLAPKKQEVMETPQGSRQSRSPLGRVNRN